MKDKIRNILSILLDIDEAQITNGIDKDSVKQWDSLAQMNLIVALEEEFGIEFGEEEALLTDSYQKLCELVEQKLRLRQTV